MSYPPSLSRCGGKVETFAKFFKKGDFSMLLYQRQNEILNYLNKNECATIKELANIVWVSESSIRRDIKSLEEKGLVKQVYGGVMLPYQNTVIPSRIRDTFNSAVKDTLAQTAAKHIFDGATILMDSSSTVKRIIKYMGNFHNIRIITNNQNIFNECNNNEIKLYSTGGHFVNQNNVFVGSAAEEFIRNIYVDILFLSSQAISDNGEISDISERETSIRKVMLTRAKKKIFLCDSSKIGLKKTFTLCTKDDLDLIICDKKLPWEEE
jgi:DeoR/GlpR family transcriptional regulator of sugar metabolism